MRVINTILIISLIASVIICCPDGWRKDSDDNDKTEYCSKRQSYDRGPGFAWKGTDSGFFSLKDARKRCEKANPDLGCEKWGEMYYPKCKEGYGNDACCYCSIRGGCPSGYKSLGIHGNRLDCQKKD